MKRIWTVFLTLASFAGWSAESLEVQHWQTSNGARVVFHPAMNIPMLDIGIAFAAGSAYDQEQWGISALTTRLLDKGNQGLDAKTLADNLARTGAQYSATNNQDMIFLGLRTLSNEDALNKAVHQFTLIINHPDFPSTAFDHEKNLQLLTLTKIKESPDILAHNTFYQILYGEHPYSHPIEGNYNTLQKINVEHVRRFYQRYFVGRNAVIAIVGAIDATTAHRLAEEIAHDLPAGQPATAIPFATSPTKEINIEVTYPSSQTQVRIGQLGISHHDANFYPLQVGNYILGGNGLDSDLNNELRLKRGLTYGVNSQFLPMPGRGPFIISFATKTNQTKAALTLTRETLSKFIELGPTPQQLKAAQQYLTGSFPFSYASNHSIAEMLLKIEFYHLPSNFLAMYVANINAVTGSDIKKAFQTLINPNQLLQISVGKT